MPTDPTSKPIECKTGEPCPQTGEWQLKTDKSITELISKPYPMPGYDGKNVTWVLIQPF